MTPILFAAPCARHGMRRIASALLLTAISGRLALSQQAGAAPASLIAAADRVFETWNNTHGPGCAVGIARGGTTLLERGYGMADLAGERPITPQTILESGSVAKQFTATAVMMLVADGTLALDDDARKYLPELPVYDRVITVRNLLTHTSGLREWSNLVGWQGWPRGTRVHTNADVFRLITAQRRLNYPVGDHYSYTNSGFLLLRTLVERVSGKDFEVFTAERIFAPLGMTHTAWRGDFTRIVPGLAPAYSRTSTGWRLDVPFDNVIAAGGLWTTIGDWLRWNQHLTTKTLGSAVVDSLTRQMRLTSGLQIAYALGLTVGRYRGTTEIGHGGNTAGYSTYLARYPELGDLSIAVMCNAAGADGTGYTHALVDALHPTLPREAVPDTVATDRQSLLAWRGLYEDQRWHTIVRLDTSNGLMRMNAAPLKTLVNGQYLAGTSRIRLAAGTGTAARTIRTATSDGDSVTYVWRSANPWTPTAAELAAIAGDYRNDEIGVTFAVRVRDGTLVLSPRAGVESVLVPTVQSAFESDAEAVWFTRDPRGTIVEMHFGSPRVWDFVSVRVR